MKTITCIFISTITVMLAGVVMAENSTPPGGPYRSINQDNQSTGSHNRITNSQPEGGSEYKKYQVKSLNRNFKNQNSSEIPEWIKQRQAEIHNFMKQNNSYMQHERNNNKFKHPENSEWAKQQQPQMERFRTQSNMPPLSTWNNQTTPMMNPGSRQLAPNNKMYYPPMRGPVSGGSALRGPVFRPKGVPPGFNNRQGNRRPQPSMWR